MKNKLDRINGRFNIAEDSEDVTSGTHITRHKEKIYLWKGSRYKILNFGLK